MLSGTIVTLRFQFDKATGAMHTFHIPVMGLSFTIDTPLKVARYGIDSVISIGNDTLLEDMRAYYARKHRLDFHTISDREDDSRARRITAYLNLVDRLVKEQMNRLRRSSLDTESELTRYLDLMPDDTYLKAMYRKYRERSGVIEKQVYDAQIRQGIRVGSIDVNIMTKLDKPNKDQKGHRLPPEFGDAMAALRGFANSTLNSSVVFSAGFNPRLYGYIDQFPDFFPDPIGRLAKKVILKVSDYRSALIQGKYLAKKGVWVSEFRVESGLNCGGHAFPTDGMLLGPILEEFKAKRDALREELFALCQPEWNQRGCATMEEPPPLRITVQGGIGTANEHRLLLHHYDVQSAGWGTPFLLVPDATNVDDSTLSQLMVAKSGDLYLSNSSPLGVPFNNLRQSASEQRRLERIEKGRPGSPCLKKHLVSNTEFTKEPICTASRKYQHHKLRELKKMGLTDQAYQRAYEDVVAKSCLCEDLTGTAYVNYGLKAAIEPKPAICPGPNLAYFSEQYTLEELVDHIYGRANVLWGTARPHMFVKELEMYIDFLEGEMEKLQYNFTEKKAQYLNGFKENLQKGVAYYQDLARNIDSTSFVPDLRNLAHRLNRLEPMAVH